MQHMARDKKVLDGQLRLILLPALGNATVTADYPVHLLEATLNADYANLTAESIR